MTALAAAAAAAAVLLLLHPRPRPQRVTALVATGRSRPGLRSAVVLAGIGRPLRRAVRLPPGAGQDRLAGGVALLATAALVVGPVVPAAGLGAALLARRWRQLREVRRGRERRPVDDLPDLIDLLALTVGAGLTVPGSLPVVARWAPPTLRPAVSAAGDAVAAGVPVAAAVTTMAERWGDDARPLARALVDHVTNGTPLLPVLRRLGADARARRRRAAETRARRLPVLLLLPLVLCTLPAFGLLTVAPIVAGTLRSLDGERLEASAASTTLPREDPCTPSSSPPTSRRCPSPAAPPAS